MKKYVHESSLKESIKNFKETGKREKQYFGLFLFFKGLGFSGTAYRPFPKSGDMDADLKKKCTGILYDLGGLFDPSEEPGKRTCLFPFSMSKTVETDDYYNGGSQFSTLLSRIRDTLDNTLIDRGFIVKETSNDTYKLHDDYLLKLRDMIEEKIDLVDLVIWINRFKAIELPNGSTIPNSKVLKALIKQFTDDYGISEDEYRTLFENSGKDIMLSDSPITGKKLRENLTFASGAAPEITAGGHYDLPNRSRILDKTELEILLKSLQENPSTEEIQRLLENYKQVILYGPPGTGKSYETKRLQSKYFEFKVIQFHPNYSYEDFIGGISVKDGKLEKKTGVFLELCHKAASNPTKKFLLVIDEINRGNLPNIFGEAILSLDRDYEASLPMEYSIGTAVVSKLKIPNNLFIVATMNSSDRSIGRIDYAIRRRFGFIRFSPDYELLEGVKVEGSTDFSLTDFLEKINSNLLRVLREPELLIGPTYILTAVKDGKMKSADLRDIFNCYILPLLEEYTYNDKSALTKILGPGLARRHSDQEKFMEKAIEFLGSS